MTDHLFDNFVREKLADHSSPVPGGLWDKIEAATAEKNRKKGLAGIPAAYRVAALLLLCAGASALFFWPRQQNERSQGSRTSVVHPDKQLQQTFTSGSADSSTTGFQEQAAATNNSTTANGNSNDKAAEQIIHNNGAKSLSSAVSSAATNEVKDKKANETIAASGSEAQRFSGASRSNVEPHLNNQQKNNRSFNTFNRAASDMMADKGNTIDAVGTTNNNSEELAAFSMLPAELISLKTLSAGSTGSLRQFLENKGSMMPVIRCPVVRNSIPTDMYVEVYGSPVVPFKQTSANYGGADYLARKDSSQQLRTSFSAGIRLSKGLTENLFVKAGIDYTQINEHFNYRQENERKQVTVITEHTINRPQGDTVLRDTSSYEQIGYLQKRVHNRYKSINIPVLFSYEWGSDQWRLAATAGVIVNLQSWYTGEMLDTSFQVVSVKNSNNEVYKKNIGLGLYAGFSFIKPVSERMDVFAEPYFRYNLSNMTRPGQPFNQRVHTAGLSLGIRYRLNGGQRF